DRPRFAAENVAVRLGPAEALSTLDFARLEGDFIAGGVAGDYAGGEGLLYNVPIRLSESDGGWRFVRGMLDLDGDGVLTSTSRSGPMFEPIATDDLALHLENNVITVAATLDTPEARVEIAQVDLRHNLATGRGEALLDTPRLEFNDNLRIEDVTPVLIGVVADVDGLVSGTGRLAWSPEEMTSTGSYQLIDMDLAASFGPVRGLNTTLEFTDLLGLNTAPDQLATVREINPGVLVENGAIRFQLLSSNRFAVEGARWPFAGGEIVLEPTILDFGEEEVRRLTFWMIGVDAWQFVEERDFDSIAATGTFDGVLPMVFDRNGGRIEGGYLQSRDEGGTFSYRGEISDVDLGVFGTLAFDALELVRYNTMLLTFDGDLDGEMITSIDFTGVAPRIRSEGQNFIVAGLTRQLAAIPIRFDITMRAPFQGLLYSVRLLDDPTFLVTEAIARARRERETGAEQPVQPPESGTVP
ncbi:MAG: YdbH domain-containing protein, partial [Sphingomonadales bacterium]|nr:YdbH domain-containing protein [Sphingomonadales bacterium]